MGRSRDGKRRGRKLNAHIDETEPNPRLVWVHDPCVFPVPVGIQSFLPSLLPSLFPFLLPFLLLIPTCITPAPSLRVLSSPLLYSPVAPRRDCTSPLPWLEEEALAEAPVCKDRDL